MSEDNDSQKIMEEVLPSSTLEKNRSSFITDTAPRQVESSIPKRHESMIPIVPGGPPPIARSYVLKDAGGALQYEKDGNWVLDRVPRYNFRKQKPKDGNNNGPPRIKCCLQKDKEPRTFGQNVKAIYDVLSGRESYPCNECDRPVCQESVWHWLSSIVVDVSDSVKEMTKKPETSSKCCGTIDAETLKSNTKGTFAAMDHFPTESVPSKGSNPPEINMTIEVPEANASSERSPSLDSSNNPELTPYLALESTEINPSPEAMDIQIELQPSQIQETSAPENVRVSKGSIEATEPPSDSAEKRLSNSSEKRPSNSSEKRPSNSSEKRPSNPTEDTPSNPTDDTPSNPTDDTPSNEKRKSEEKPTE